MTKQYAILLDDGWHIAKWDGECYRITSNFQSGDRLLPSDINRAVLLPNERAVDRILWNEAPNESNQVGDIDEIVVHAPGFLHIEQMDDDLFWIAVYKDETDSYWMGNFVIIDDKIIFSEQENRDFPWNREESHEEG